MAKLQMTDDVKATRKMFQRDTPLYRYDASQSQFFWEVVENINYVSASFTAVKLNIMHE